MGFDLFRRKGILKALLKSNHVVEGRRMHEAHARLATLRHVTTSHGCQDEQLLRSYGPQGQTVVETQL